jgi:hypothetical protein
VKQLHRTIVGGAFGVATAATVAASAAYACHPTAQLVLSAAEGKPGTFVEVQGNGFDPGTFMEVHWGTKNAADRLLGSDLVRAVDTSPSREPQARVKIKIPDDAPLDTVMFIAVSQNPARTNTGQQARSFHVTGARATTDTTRTTATTAPPSTLGTTATTARTVQTGLGSEPVRRDGTAAPSPAFEGALSAIEGGTGGAPAAGSPSGAVGADGLPVPSASSNGSAGTPGASRLGTAEPAADDLWSALGAEPRSGLTDVAAPAGRERTSPMGVVLLGFGVATLAGIGLTGARRRLAPARRVV